mmetsp:Transcript_11963/g.19833  ORF Transcript_11963/g.19833 Transcript_11963/m.19833 type:complete len:358 (+) Transcript_11963:144-1217(+)|eukprot:CAMPEP_0119022520 /NCGR_PEP_ID=MMETSP1176-20130426/28201_1 /TAXON_ID=265551 /ORGANISM="Synedropsis recta cf, Strain CCMP1620" /LENGTH=357 /DNA_ID=CAMNT_0006977407 /DNA_START=85 /DNA_END=1158 /DNA_ORIENTATION=-
MMLLCSLLLLCALSLASAERVHYLQDIGYPVAVDYNPNRILVQAIPVASNPILQISCSGGMAPDEVHFFDVDSGGGNAMNQPLLLEKGETSVNVSQTITGSRFRFSLQVHCPINATYTPVLQFHNYKAGVYIESCCFDKHEEDKLAVSLSWTRAWGQVQHSSAVQDDHLHISTQLRPRQVEIPMDGTYMKQWDTLEIALSNQVVNHAQVTLGCVREHQPPSMIVKLPTVLDDEDYDNSSNDNNFDGFPGTDLTPEAPLLKPDCSPQPLSDDCPGQTVPCGYVFFASKTYAGLNLGKYHGVDTNILAQFCNQQHSQCLAFNSDGWYKRVIPPKSEWQDHGGPCEGTYIKEDLVADIEA